MCGIWDWQSTIVKDLNDSQDPKHTLFCREIVFVAIYALFSDNKCPLFTRLGGGVSKSATFQIKTSRFVRRVMRRVRLAPAQHLLTVVAPRLPKVLLPILFKQLREVQPHHTVALLSRGAI